MTNQFFHDQFVDAIDQCRQLCVDQVVECYVASPNHLDMNSDEFFAEVQHRFNCLVIKAFVETAESDLVLSPAEAELAKVLVEHLLKERVKSNRLNANFQRIASIAKATSWGTALEPLKWFEQSQTSFEEIKSSVLRIAKIVSKVDGNTRGETISQLKMIRMQLDQFLPVIHSQAAHDDDEAPPCGEVSSETSHEISQALIKLLDHNRRSQQKAVSTDAAPMDQGSSEVDEPNAELTEAQREELLQAGTAELDSLIGVDAIRREIQTLVNVCKVQQYRVAHSMPVNTISLHMVFTGNPGTGKTTVARIAAKLLGAIGVIKRGHLIETDRSGLVAEFQGQTATKTNATIDEALDGVLFIDEAYSLVPESQADSYGQEAIQTLLKRMEDDRDRLIVILAGYTEPMELLLKSNPGLSSRFSRRCHFPDYEVAELAEIFDLLATKQHYQMTDDFRAELERQIEHQVASKDEHFGNGRMVRNLFENAIRNMANRIVEASELTPELLSTFQASDLSSDLGELSPANSP